MLAAKLSVSFTIADLKAKGAKVRKAEGALTNGVHISLNGDTFYASKCKTFEGELTENTTIFEGKNANGEPRLYLTNKVGGFKLGVEL